MKSEAKSIGSEIKQAIPKEQRRKLKSKYLSEREGDLDGDLDSPRDLLECVSYLCLLSPSLTRSLCLQLTEGTYVPSK